MKKLITPIAITAADSNSRTITGRIVTWGEEGNTSAGRTIFSENSIQFGKNVKLLLEHEMSKPIGKMLSAEVTDTGIEAKFKLANTTVASDALVEAAEGLRDGFSVGVKLNDWANQDGAMVISSAKLIEVSLVTEPAIDSAASEKGYKLTKGQRDALISFDFNTGDGAKLIKTSQSLEEIKNRMPSWNKITKDGVKVESKGLNNRRNQELQKWNS